MAKLTITYENNIEKRELEFNGEKFDFSMIPNEHGATGDKPGFETQVPKKFPQFSGNELILDAIDRLDWEEDSDGILEALDDLANEGY